MIDHDELRLPLLRTFEESLSRFRVRNVEREFADGPERVRVPDFAEQAFREALVNAFVHRDYAVSGGVCVRMSDEDISITSPGDFVRGISLENFLMTEPRSRNPLLANIFRRIGLAEKSGRGIERIYSAAALYGRPWPDYSESTDGFVRVRVLCAEPNLAFFKRVLSYRKRFARSLSTAAMLIMTVLKDAPGCSAAEIRRRTGMCELRIIGQIRTLLHEVMIEVIGGGYRLLYASAASPDRMPKYYGSLEPYSDRTAEIIRLVRERRVVRREDVVKALGMTPQQAYRLLRKMTESGLLVRSGAKKTAMYGLPDSM